MGIASLVLGIVGVLLGWMPIVGIITAIFCSLPAIILGVISLRRKKKVGISRAGIILGAIGSAYFLYIIIGAIIELR